MTRTGATRSPAIAGLAFVAGALAVQLCSSDRRAALVADNARLEATLAPFTSAARRAYPGDDTAGGLRKLAEQLDHASAAPTPQVLAAGRALTRDQESGLASALAAVTNPNRTLWLVLAPSAEAQAFAKGIAAVFTRAGWRVETSQWPTGSVKAGNFFFVADESAPEYVEAAQRALEGAGLKLVVASGYRAFAEERRRTNPGWAGVTMAAGQQYALVIGPPVEGG